MIFEFLIKITVFSGVLILIFVMRVYRLSIVVFGYHRI